MHLFHQIENTNTHTHTWDRKRGKLGTWHAVSFSVHHCLGMLFLCTVGVCAVCLCVCVCVHLRTSAFFCVSALACCAVSFACTRALLGTVLLTGLVAGFPTGLVLVCPAPVPVLLLLTAAEEGEVGPDLLLLWPVARSCLDLSHLAFSFAYSSLCQARKGKRVIACCFGL